MPSMGAMPGLPPLPPGVPGLGVSPPLVASVTPAVPSLVNGAPAMIQPMSGFSHPGTVNKRSHYPGQLIQCLLWQDNLWVFASVSQLVRSTKPLHSIVPVSSYRRASQLRHPGTHTHTHTHTHTPIYTVFTDILLMLKAHIMNLPFL